MVATRGLKRNICPGMHEIDNTHAGSLQFLVGAISYDQKAMKINSL